MAEIIHGMHECRPAVRGVLLENESIVDEAPIEDEVMGAGDEQRSLLVVREVNSGVGTSTWGTHGRAIDLVEVAVAKGKHITSHDQR
jgi:hypothetical protein